MDRVVAYLLDEFLFGSSMGWKNVSRATHVIGN